MLLRVAEVCITAVVILAYLFLTIAAPMVIINRPSQQREEDGE